MLTLYGRNAQEDYKIKVKAQHLAQKFDAEVQVFWQYLISSTQDLTSEELDRLGKILLADPQPNDTTDSNSAWFITPRIGTTSAWCSKALEIIKLCGLPQITAIKRIQAWKLGAQNIEPQLLQDELDHLYDPMTESLLFSPNDLMQLLSIPAPRKLAVFDLAVDARAKLNELNRELGLALQDAEIDYLIQYFSTAKQELTDAELMMFAQANSEHCRHKIFNAKWQQNGAVLPHSLFGMIKNTATPKPAQVLVAYHDNAAVLKGHWSQSFYADPQNQNYTQQTELIDVVLKVETHNHPTAISPYPGAATGSGGEIRDEAATGRGAATKAGIVGFTVSNLNLPDFPQAWEHNYGKPHNMQSALQIMIEGPIGNAAFNNEFGRPSLAGYFRTMELNFADQVWGYHKPIMIAGGIGSIINSNIYKKSLPVGAPIIVLGGPAMLIGLGGGAASSASSGSNLAALDFSSVQRSNPQMQRLCQEVINRCARSQPNPILSIHDVGAGGLSNAVPELVYANRQGARIELALIPCADPSMSPMEIWCNESQERYVMAIEPSYLEQFAEFCARERCPFAVIGQVTAEPILELIDPNSPRAPISLPLPMLFDNPPKYLRQLSPEHRELIPAQITQIDLATAIERVLSLPAVASKNFLITIGDRSVGGLTARDQLVGPWQVPVADAMVTLTDYYGYTGTAAAVGERPLLALLDSAASARISVGEAITNLAATDIGKIENIILSANWMAACQEPQQDEDLYAAVHAVGMEFCPALGISIPVGKDSLSMSTKWNDTQTGAAKKVTSPVTLVTTATATVTDVRKTVTPELKKLDCPTELILIDLGNGKARLGGSALLQVYQQVGSIPPDIQPQNLQNFFAAIQNLLSRNLLLAYHDRSDGGLLTSLCEMSFAARCGITLNLTHENDLLPFLFNEELGAVIQIKADDRPKVWDILVKFDLAKFAEQIGTPNARDEFEILAEDKLIYRAPRQQLQEIWSRTSYEIQKLRDNPQCAAQEFSQISQANSGLYSKVSESLLQPSLINSGIKPKIAILREQGINGHVEMAAAFTQAGFDCIDLHMSDLYHQRRSLAEFKGLICCGGFSYGDVLGAGRGWALTILNNPVLYNEFAAFFARSDSFALGVCNGCQMLSQLTSIIPGTAHWPQFKHNLSAQFESRLCMVKIHSSKSLLFSGMQDAELPIVVAHGEGLAKFTHYEDLENLRQNQQVCLSYLDYQGQVTETYPCNPNGSPRGITGLCNADGRITIVMPHPERLFRTVTNSWHPENWGEYSPWFRMFQNAQLYR